MPEYQVHILNWPIEADTPEEAARTAFEKMNEEGGRYFIFRVTDQEGKILPWDAETRDFFKVNEPFDSQEWEPKAVFPWPAGEDVKKFLEEYEERHETKED